MPTLPGTPTIDQHAATKLYVDGIIPTATIFEYGGTALPDGYLWCDGASYSTTGTYADLFGYIQYAYGGAGGNFNVPNMANRVTVGKGTGAFATLGATGGSADLVAVAHTHTSTDHTHTTADHSHTTADHSHTFSGATNTDGAHGHTQTGFDYGANLGYLYRGPGGGGWETLNGSGSITWSYATPDVSSSGSSHAHGFSGTTSGASNGNTTSGASTGNTTSGASTGNTTASQSPTATGVGANYPPYVVVNYIIKT
jgi:microcystin-dependent protein